MFMIAQWFEGLAHVRGELEVDWRGAHGPTPSIAL